MARNRLRGNIDTDAVWQPGDPDEPRMRIDREVLKPWLTGAVSSVIGYTELALLKAHPSPDLMTNIILMGIGISLAAGFLTLPTGQDFIEEFRNRRQPIAN